MSNPFKKKKSKSVSAKLLRNHRVLHAWRETILQISVQIARHIERATQVTQQARGFLFADASGNSLGNMWTRAHVYLLWIIHAGVYVYMYIHVRAYVRTDARKLGCGIPNAHASAWSTSANSRGFCFTRFTRFADFISRFFFP